jgi:hypothetical protein
VLWQAEGAFTPEASESLLEALREG